MSIGLNSSYSNWDAVIQTNFISIDSTRALRSHNSIRIELRKTSRISAINKGCFHIHREQADNRFFFIFRGTRNLFKASKFVTSHEFFPFLCILCWKMTNLCGTDGIWGLKKIFCVEVTDLCGTDVFWELKTSGP